MITKIIAPKRLSDISEEKGGCWGMDIFRSKSPKGDGVVMKRGNIKFKISLGTNEVGVDVVKLTKYIGSEEKWTKRFYDPGDGIDGQYCISEGITDNETYAFFRPWSIVMLMCQYGINRVLFPKESEYEGNYKFTRTVDNYDNTGVPPFHTDGQYDKTANGWTISGASYVYEYNTGTLTIPWQYDLNKLTEDLDALTQ